MWVEQSEQVDQVFAALAKTQAAIQGARRDRKNPHFKSEYATLASMWDAWQAAGPANGLCIIQCGAELDGKPVLVTTLGHASGQWMRGYYPLTALKHDPQGIASATTYARRNALAAMVGLCPVDDDGESAMDRREADPQKSSPPKPEPPKPQPPKKSEPGDDNRTPYERMCARLQDEYGAGAVTAANLELKGQHEGDVRRAPEELLRKVFKHVSRAFTDQTRQEPAATE